MKIVLAAVMYSPNLGDGLIAECLTAGLQAQQPGAQVHWLDLAGRRGFEPPRTGLRTRILDLLARLPTGMSQMISRRLVTYQINTRLDPLIAPALTDADMVIIGGGQLFGDANLNFPLKLAHLVAAAEARDLPFAIHSVGVSGTWTTAGRCLFSKVLTSPCLRFISVRDAASARNLRQHYEVIGVEPPVAIHVSPDPGLLAAEIELPITGTSVPRKRTIGLGVVHPAALSTHAASKAQFGVKQSADAYAALTERLMDLGCAVHVFTNGAGEDEDMLDAVWPKLHHMTDVVRVPRAETPASLASALRNLDAVASHRLHACIGANALGIKAVGFKWDTKIDAFFDLTDQPENLFDDLQDVEAIAATLMAPMSDRTRTKLADLKPRVGDGLQRLLLPFTGSVPEAARAEVPNTPLGQPGLLAKPGPKPARRKSSTVHSETHGSPL